MPIVLCFVSSRLLRLAKMVNGINIHDLHCAPPGQVDGGASQCYWFGFPTAPLDRDAATSWVPFRVLFSGL